MKRLSKNKMNLISQTRSNSVNLEPVNYDELDGKYGFYATELTFSQFFETSAELPPRYTVSSPPPQFIFSDPEI